jgi:hypothetical protein
MQAITLINNIQRELRLPQAAAITEAHAQLILGFINTVQRDLMLENYVWDEQKTYGYFETEADSFLYTVTGSSSYEIDVIRNLQISTYDPLTWCSDSDFRAYKRSYGTTTGRPLYWRVYSRSGGDSIVVELTPTPDAVYQVDTEALIKPKRLSAADDETMLDPDIIFLGALMLARKEQGDDYSGDLAAFQAKLMLQGDNQGESNFGDVEAI